MVYAAALCPISYEPELKQLGFADSKTLTHQTRSNLLQIMIDKAGSIEWNVKVLSPSDISMAMTRKIPYNL